MSFHVTIAPPAPSETMVGSCCEFPAVQIGRFVKGLCGQAASDERGRASVETSAARIVQPSEMRRGGLMRHLMARRPRNLLNPARGTQGGRGCWGGPRLRP